MRRATLAMVLAGLCITDANARQPSRADAGELARLEARIAQLEAALEQRPRDVSRYRLPKTISFCGETYDTTKPGVRERFERELLLILGSRHQVVLWARRAHGVFPVIESKAKARGTCADLKYVAVIESGLRSGVTSHASAKGWWQFMAGTARQYGLLASTEWDERADLGASTDAGLRYLAALHRDFGRWDLAMAAYNTGPGRMRKAIRTQGTDDFWRLDLYTEAERYVPRVLAIKAVLADLPRYDFHFDDAAGWARAETGFVKTRVPKGLEVSVLAAARGAGIDYRELRLLNPELGRDVLPTNREVVLEVPAGEERALRGWLTEAYAKQAKAKPRRVSKRKSGRKAGRKKHKKRLRKTYTIRRGDSLWSIAQRQSVSVESLRRWNGLARRSVITPGQKLVVRPAR